MEYYQIAPLIVTNMVVLVGGAWLLLRAWTKAVEGTRKRDAELTTTLVKEVTKAITGRGEPAQGEVADLEEMLEGVAAYADLPEEHMVPDVELDPLMFPQDTQSLMEGNPWSQENPALPQEES